MEELEPDTEFESAFPILCFSFVDLRKSLDSVLKDYDGIDNHFIFRGCIEIAHRVELTSQGFSQKVQHRVTRDVTSSHQ